MNENGMYTIFDDSIEKIQTAEMLKKATKLQKDRRPHTHRS